MGRIRPRSFFANYVRVVWRCVDRHDRAVILWRLFRDVVLAGSGGSPVAFCVMLWRAAREVMKVIRYGPGEVIRGWQGA